MTVDKLVSVGVAAYNEADCIKECLESIAADGYPNKEIIISDNASTDSTWEIIERFKNEYENAYRIHIIRQEGNKGAVFNFNYVLEQARGEYFTWVGAHDAWGRNFIKECVAVLESNPEAALVMPLVMWVDEDSNVLELPHGVIDTRSGRSQAKRAQLLISQWTNCTAIYGLHRKDILLSTLPWPRTLGADKLGLLRIAKQGDIVPIESTRYFRRARAGEMSEGRICRQLRALNVEGMAYRKPRTMNELHIAAEAILMKGPLPHRAHLFIRVLRRFLGMLLLESFPAVHNTLRRIRFRLSA